MEPLKYQLFIIASIGVTYWMGGKRKALLLATFWSLWTLLLLNYPPLIVTQLLFAWGTYAICCYLFSSRQRIRDLEHCLAAMDEETRRRMTEATRSSRTSIVKGEEHLQELFNATRTAKRRVVILSGWISSSIVDRNFIALLERRAREGVSFVIGYGWQNSRGSHAELESTKEALRDLDLLSGRVPEMITVVQFPNHAKMLIKDQDFLICGSNNWLSNRRFRNAETSIKIESPSLVQQETEEILRIVAQRADRSVF